jgi:hypothetical protein
MVESATRPEYYNNHNLTLLILFLLFLLFLFVFLFSFPHASAFRTNNETSFIVLAIAIIRRAQTTLTNLTISTTHFTFDDHN